uniref:Uncharacterized protein n=1 Tax=Pipistrellus kuhlii TaxID=59472 RepID=A0A7J7RMD6_PIPKU|nr:hypothetical protein mPipKuh1_010401 [Pipistrellus kuhlii]
MRHSPLTQFVMTRNVLAVGVRRQARFPDQRHSLQGRKQAPSQTRTWGWSRDNSGHLLFSLSSPRADGASKTSLLCKAAAHTLFRSSLERSTPLHGRHPDGWLGAFLRATRHTSMWPRPCTPYRVLTRPVADRQGWRPSFQDHIAFLGQLRSPRDEQGTPSSSSAGPEAHSVWCWHHQPGLCRFPSPSCVGSNVSVHFLNGRYPTPP